MTPEPNNNNSETAEERCLKEELKLSELFIMQQGDTFRELDRKAALFVTLCVAIIAYIISSVVGSDADTTLEMKLFSFLTIAVLARAAWIGASVSFTKEFGLAGYHPKNLTKNEHNRDYKVISEEVLQHYKEHADINDKAIVKKSELLDSSTNWGKVGIILACLWVILIFFGDELFKIVCMLCSTSPSQSQ